MGTDWELGGSMRPSGGLSGGHVGLHPSSEPSAGDAVGQVTAGAAAIIS